MTTDVPSPTVADVGYAAGSPSQHLDLWLPDAPTAPAPVVVFIHGGGWYYGSRDMVGPKVGPLLAAGFAVASIDYRMSGEAPFPAAVDDARAAVGHLRRHAAEAGLDPDRIVLWGESAGANIACVVGALSGRAAPWDSASPDAPGPTPPVAAVVDWFGPTDFLAMDEQAAEIGCAPSSHSADDSPESRYVGSPVRTAPDLAALAGPLPHLAAGADGAASGEDAPPLPAVAIAHGTADCTVAPGQSRLLVEALRARGAEPWVTWLEGAEHSDPRFDAELLAPTIDWLCEVLGR
ncbi:alpha/beta hydrolase fold domain-containing protein [Isoptericola rhizosphaerae]|uniref:alpha/beta hydrolase fold domain-containing protein n=1 Tax=Isoptericola rhizosphaerae TaxID=3377837 RepID=UPI00383B2F8F